MTPHNQPPLAIVQFDHGINTPRRAGATIAERFDAYASTRPGRDLVVVTDQYEAGPFPRWNMVFGANQRQAESRARVLTHWHMTHPSVPIVLVGHSNGCDIARRTAIILHSMIIPVALLVFVAAPLDRRFEKTGLAPLRRFTDIRIANWVMERDEVLAADTDRLGAAIRWPYGNAGKVGFDRADGWARRYEDRNPAWRIWNRRFPFFHSEAFSGTYERPSFEMIIREIESIAPAAPAPVE